METIKFSALKSIARNGDYTIFLVSDSADFYVFLESYSYVWEVENYYLLPKTFTIDFEPIHENITAKFWMFLSSIKEGLEKISVNHNG
jgi:hypothetical protein